MLRHKKRLFTRNQKRILKIAGSGDVEEFAHVKPEEKKLYTDEENIFVPGSGGAFRSNGRSGS